MDRFTASFKTKSTVSTKYRLLKIVKGKVPGPSRKIGLSFCSCDSVFLPVLTRFQLFRHDLGFTLGFGEVEVVRDPNLIPVLVPNVQKEATLSQWMTHRRR